MNRRQFLQTVATVATAVILPPAWRRYMSSPPEMARGAGVSSAGIARNDDGAKLPPAGLAVPISIPIAIGRDPQPHRAYIPFVRGDQ